MKHLIITLLIFVSGNIWSQRQLSLDNNLTGLYSENKNGTQFGLNYVGNNSLDFNKNLSLDFVTNYALRFNPKMNENEFIQRLVFDYHKKNWDVFTTYQYNYSLIREISADNWVGAGAGVKHQFTGGKVSVSYATLIQNQHFFIDSTNLTLRHSFRARIKWEKKLFGFSTEYFYQPSFTDFSDFLVLGTTKLTILPKNSFSLVIQDVLNFRSVSSVKTIHNLTIGFSYKFSKEWSKS
jgi:hypothetical protein